MKFTPFWHGPFTIMKITSPVNCLISPNPSHPKGQKVHISRLKLYVGHRKPEELPIDLRLDENLEEKDEEPLPVLKEPELPSSVSEDPEEIEIPDLIERGKGYF